MQLENDSGFLQQAGCERILGNVFILMYNNSNLLHQLYRSHIEFTGHPRTLHCCEFEPLIDKRERLMV